MAHASGSQPVHGWQSSIAHNKSLHISYLEANMSNRGGRVISSQQQHSTRHESTMMSLLLIAVAALQVAGAVPFIEDEYNALMDILDRIGAIGASINGPVAFSF